MCAEGSLTAALGPGTRSSACPATLSPGDCGYWVLCVALAALSHGFLLQDIVATGVGEASEKRDEPAAGEAVSPAAWCRASQGWHGTAGALRQALLGWGDTALC